MSLLARLSRALLMIFLWGLAGGLFGALFVSIRYLLGDIGLQDWYPVLIAICAAAMTTAALYSAMFVSLVGAAAGMLGSIGYLMFDSDAVDLLAITGVAAGAGLLAGIFFSRGPAANARAFSVTLAGFLAGSGAGLGIAIALRLFPSPLDQMVVVAGVVALVGALFELNKPWLMQGCSCWPWTRLGGALVAALIASVVGAGVWLLTGTASNPAVWNSGQGFHRLLDGIPPGLIGGAVGGAMTGFLLELLGFRLTEEHHDD